MSKQYGQEDLLSDLIAKACASVMPEKTTFNVDNIRVCKVSIYLHLYLDIYLWYLYFLYH